MNDLDLSVTLQQHQDRYILAMLHDCKGNISLAADRLGIYRSSLQRRMRKEPLASKARAVIDAWAGTTDIRREPAPRRVRKKRPRPMRRMPTLPPGTVFYWRGIKRVG